jgi:hypothetical protein
MIGPTLYTKVVQAVLQRCTFPATFTSWEEEEELDEDEFFAYRRSTSNLLMNIATFMLDGLVDMVSNLSLNVIPVGVRC